MSTEPLQYDAYVADKPTLDVCETKCTARPLNKDDVAIAVECSGICHTDIHELLNEWKDIGSDSPYPMCAGHEAIGTVTEVGASVTHLKVGDRVGCGYQRDSCRECEDCRDGWENACTRDFKALMHKETGGFASHLRVPSHMAFKIPDGISSHEAAPLMCAGATVWTPLNCNGLQAGAKVGVVGIGGLGHLAVQFAHKMGYEVTAISRGTGKKGFAEQLGASFFLDSTDAQAMKDKKGYFDLIVSTASANVDVNQYLSLLRRQCKLVMLGLGGEDLKVNPFALGGGNHFIGGSSIAGSVEMAKMLQFAADHDVRPIIEVVKAPFQSNSEEVVRDALKRVRDGKPRFRLVLDYSK